MTDTGENKPRRRTQLNAAQYDGWQQELDDSIPIIHTKQPPRSAEQPARSANTAQPANPQPSPQRAATQPNYGASGQMHGFRAVQGTPVQPAQNWNNGVQPLDGGFQPTTFSWQPMPNTQPVQPMNGRSALAQGGRPMPNTQPNAAGQTGRTQNTPYQQPYSGWQQPYQAADSPFTFNGNGGNGGNPPPSGFAGFTSNRRDEPPHIQRKPPNGRKNLKRVLFCVCAVVVVCGLVAAGNAVSNAMREQRERDALVASVTAYDDRYVPNVYVDGIDLGGMTRAEAEQAVSAHANQQRDAWKVRLMYAGQLVREITSADLNMTVDVREALDLAWQPGHSEESIDARRETMDALAVVPYEGYSATPSGDNVVIDNMLLNIAQQAYIAPSDAQIVFNPSNFSNPLTITPETVGRYMDTTEAKTRVYQMMSSLESGEVELTTRELQPSKTTAMLQSQIQLRATAYTPISTTSTENRNLNIQVALNRINGYMLEPGQTFSFNNIVGRRTKANGFYEAIEYAYGDERMGYGGGVCQASTTMYLAAAKANMTIVKREPHSDAVGYTDYGKDATVSDNRIDFQFRNDTGSTVFIVATVTRDSRYDKTHQVCIVSIYGESLGSGVKYDLVTKTVQTLPAPVDPEIRKDTKHTYATYVDQEYVYRKARDGYVVASYLVKYVNNVETERTLMYTDTYKAKSEIIYVGTVERTEEQQ